MIEPSSQRRQPKGADSGQVFDVSLPGRAQVLTRAFRVAPVALFAVDLTARVLAWNHAAAALYGWEVAEIVGRPVTAFVDVDEIDAVLDLTTRGQQAQPFHSTHRSRSAGELFVEVRWTELRDDDDRLVGVVAAVTLLDDAGMAPQDEQSQSFAEEQLRARLAVVLRENAQLGARLHATTDENERLRRYARALAHDLAQPLAAVGGYLELIESNAAAGLDESGLRWLTAAVNAHRRTVGAVDALLRHATDRSESTPVPLDPVVREVLRGLTNELEESGASVYVHELPALPVDRGMIGQVLQNVLVNACRYRDPERPLRIEIQAEVAGDVDVIRIVDNGTGFSADEHAEVFRDVTRGSAAHLDASGSGSGLATVRSIIEESGGRVWAEDTPGGGATIAIALTRITHEPSPSQPPTET